MLESKVEVNIKYETAKNKKKGHVESIEKGHNPAVFETDMISLMPVETVNQLGKIAPDVIKNASLEINNIALKRINGIIILGGKEIERVPPNILRGAMRIFIKHPHGCWENLSDNSFKN